MVMFALMICVIMTFTDLFGACFINLSPSIPSIHPYTPIDKGCGSQQAG
jgi:hypothetical protein